MKKTTVLALILLLFLSSCSDEAGPDSKPHDSKRTDMIQDTAFKDPVSQNKTESWKSDIKSNQKDSSAIPSDSTSPIDNTEPYSYRLLDRLPRITITIVSQNPQDFPLSQSRTRKTRRTIQNVRFPSPTTIRFPIRPMEEKG